jgi:hypothetical protein
MPVDDEVLKNIRVATEGEGGATSGRGEDRSVWKFAGDYKSRIDERVRDLSCRV